MAWKTTKPVAVAEVRGPRVLLTPWRRCGCWWLKRHPWSPRPPLHGMEIRFGSLWVAVQSWMCDTVHMFVVTSYHGTCILFRCSRLPVLSRSRIKKCRRKMLQQNATKHIMQDRISHCWANVNFIALHPVLVTSPSINRRATVAKMLGIFSWYLLLAYSYYCWYGCW